MLQQWIKARSLRIRLTLEVGTLTILGVGGLAAWGSWQLQQTLLATHKQTLDYIALRFPQDFETYTLKMPSERGLVRTLETVSTERVLLWVRSPRGRILTHAAIAPAMGSTIQQLDQIHQTMAIPDMALPGKVYPIQLGAGPNRRYFLACGTPLMVQGVFYGKLYVANDITLEQRQVNLVMQKLWAGSGLVTLMVVVAIALRIRTLLDPLAQVSAVARRLSLEDLDQGRVAIERLASQQTPQEIQGLVEAFNHMVQRLSMSWRSQRQFVGDASHELRTPLTVVYGYLQGILRRADNLTSYQREALLESVAETERTVRLLEDLLELARADNGTLQGEGLEPVALGEVLSEVLTLLENPRDRRITRIKLMGMDQPVWVLARHKCLCRVILNLVDNALHYSDQPVWIRVERQGTMGVIEVGDRGLGIAPEHQTRIFDRFYRVDEARSRLTGGTGLGLAIVKMLVENMAGTVTVRSQPGQGSVFEVYLPLAALDQEAR